MLLSPRFGAIDCTGCRVHDDALCQHLSGEPLDRFAAIGRRRHLVRGQPLLWEGEAADLVATVAAGALKLTVSMPDGKEQIVGIAWPGDFIGRPYGQTMPYTAIALGPVELCVFGRSSFENALARDAGLATGLARRVLSDLDRARSFMLLLGRKNAGQRVAILLLEIASRIGNSNSDGVLPLPLRRQDMADILGLTIETVSRQLGRLVEAGLIALPSRQSVVLAEPSRLEALAA